MDVLDNRPRCCQHRPTRASRFQAMPSANTPAELFRHVSAEKAGIYRSIMASFAAAKRQFRLHMRPDEVLTEARWIDGVPKLEEVQAALAQLAEWGNLEAQPDTARVASISDFYRARFLYRLSHGGDAVETFRDMILQNREAPGVGMVILDEVRMP